MVINDTTRRMIVASEQLATGEGVYMSEFEFGLTVVNNAYQKWITRCAVAAGQPELTPLDILTLHNINHRGVEKRRIDICFLLNIEDSHTVNYALKKLSKFGLVQGTKRGKEMFYGITDTGKDFCLGYRSVRDSCLISSLKSIDKNIEDLSVIAETLRALSGLYDQASRAAASM